MLPFQVIVKAADHMRQTFCKYSLIKYSSRSFEDLEAMDNEDDAEEGWSIFSGDS